MGGHDRNNHVEGTFPSTRVIRYARHLLFDNNDTCKQMDSVSQKIQGRFSAKDTKDIVIDCPVIDDLATGRPVGIFRIVDFLRS